MTPAQDALAAACRRARWAGLALGFGLPLLAAAALFGGLVPAGTNQPDGAFLQLGHTLTGLVFLGAAWAVWRRGRVLAGLRTVPEARRGRVVMRESVLYSALAGASSLCGAVYWSQVGWSSLRHVLGFLVLSPLLCLALVPRPGAWRKASEGAP